VSVGTNLKSNTKPKDHAKTHLLFLNIGCHSYWKFRLVGHKKIHQSFKKQNLQSESAGVAQVTTSANVISVILKYWEIGIARQSYAFSAT